MNLIKKLLRTVIEFIVGVIALISIIVGFVVIAATTLVIMAVLAIVEYGNFIIFNLTLKNKEKLWFT